MYQLSATSFLARHFLPCVITMTIAMGGAVAHAQTVPAQTRGELLYATHCLTCHTSQMHWRNNRRAYDWDSLKAQVRVWQGNAGLQWGEADIAEVAGYLNNTVYQYPQTANRVGLISGSSGKISGVR
jgi:mono/diheme cytochrome c family protein